MIQKQPELKTVQCSPMLVGKAMNGEHKIITRLHHVAIVTANINDAVRYYLEILRCETPKIVQVDKPGARFQSAMLPIGATGESFLQLVEPSEGPGLDELEREGEGTILELAFQVDNIEEFYDEMISKGITPVDIAGQPFSGKCIVSSFGNKYFFLPRTQTRGTRIEVVQVVRTASG